MVTSSIGRHRSQLVSHQSKLSNYYDLAYRRDNMRARLQLI